MLDAFDLSERSLHFQRIDIDFLVFNPEDYIRVLVPEFDHSTYEPNVDEVSIAHGYMGVYKGKNRQYPIFVHSDIPPGKMLPMKTDDFERLVTGGRLILKPTIGFEEA